MGILLFLILLGCSVKYSIESPRYAEHKGEINQHIRLVRAQEKRIFQILTQEGAFQGICPKGVVVTFKPAAPYGVGTLIKTGIMHIFSLVWDSRVEEVLPNRKIRIRFLNGFFAGGTEIWELESVGEYTQVSHTMIVEPKGLLRKLAWILKVRSKHNKIVETLLDNLVRNLGNTMLDE
jgi:hypothetical protein